MANSNPVRPNADQNLLFGILALQMDFINKDALIRAMHAWVLDKAKPLGQILLDQGALAEDELAALETLVNKHIQRHGKDPVHSLATIPPSGSIREELQQIADPDLQASLAHCQGTPLGTDDLDAAVDSSIGTDTSAGTRFRVLRPHAKGGLGEVFVAMDNELRREVALKEIQARHADHAESRTRFVREAEITGGLEHPGVVPVYALGQYPDGRPFYAMRFIRGQSMKDAIDRFHQGHGAGERTLELRQLLGRFEAVCNTMAYVHSRGVIHRDLKPANVMLGNYGETLVVDWGLAKVLGQPDGAANADEPALATVASADTDLTQPGRALGTPSYMSPEQAAGQVDRLGPASDIYSLGATLYTVLTGKAPFVSTEVGIVLGKVQLGEFPPPRQVNGQVPAALEAICLKAMALKPEERYASAKALADDIENWLGDEMVTAFEEPWWVRQRRWVRQHKGLVTAGVAGLLMVATVGVSWLLVAAATAREANEQVLRTKAEEQREMAQVERHEADTQRQLVRRLLYSSRMNAAGRAWQDNQIARMEEILLEYQKAPPGQEDLRGFEWHYLWRLRHSWLANCQGHAAWVISVTFSPDGQRVASTSLDGSVKLWDATTGRELLSLKKHTGPVLSVAFSPDGRRLVSASVDKAVKVWDSMTGQEVLSLNGHNSDVNSVAFSPDGRRLASASDDKTVKVWDTTTGQQVLSLKGHTETILSVAFSPESTLLASASMDQTVKVWDTSTGQEVLSLQGHTNYVWSVAFSPDGRHLASASYDQTVKVWDTATGQEIFSLQGHNHTVVGVAFSPDGHRLASASWDKTIKIWDATLGQEVLTLQGHTGLVTSVVFSPDGRRLASASQDGTVKVWEADALTAEEFRQPQPFGR